MPSAIWLLFYLRKDKHPESAKMVLKVFFFGVISAIPVVLIEMGIVDSINSMGFNSSFMVSVLKVFVGVALIEEFVKYLVVRGQALKSLEFDEPIDAMLYMIIAALGFAAAENILILFSLGPNFLLVNVFSLTIFRFAGATFLHALCSGALGYFLAMSFYESKKRGRIFLKGLLIVTLLHGLYNFSIIELGTIWNFVIPLSIILGLAIFVTIAFKRLKNLKSISKI
ncbi:MAG: PrsW family intramembrane metalloprotease [bacterium]